MTCPNCESTSIIQRATPVYLIATLLTTSGFFYLLVIAFTTMRSDSSESSAFTGTFYLLAGMLGLIWNASLIRRWFVQRQRPFLCRNCGHEWA